MEREYRWRVTPACRDDAYRQEGPDGSISVTVTAADAASAEVLGRALFEDELPEWLTVLSAEARHLPPEFELRFPHPEVEPRCSFCGKSQDAVKRLIAGRRVFICDECVELCAEILSESGRGSDPA